MSSINVFQAAGSRVWLEIAKLKHVRFFAGVFIFLCTFIFLITFYYVTTQYILSFRCSVHDSLFAGVLSGSASLPPWPGVQTDAGPARAPGAFVYGLEDA